MSDRPIRAGAWDEAAALSALGRTIASIARSRFDLDELLQTVVEEVPSLDLKGFSRATTAYAVRSCLGQPNR